MLGPGGSPTLSTGPRFPRRGCLIFRRPARYSLNNFAYISFTALLRYGPKTLLLFVAFPLPSASPLPTESVLCVIFGIKNFPSINFKAAEQQLREVELGRGLCVHTHAHPTPVELHSSKTFIRLFNNCLCISMVSSDNLH